MYSSAYTGLKEFDEDLNGKREMTKLKAYKEVSNWRLVEVKEFKILYLEGILDSKPFRSDKLHSFNFDRREAQDHSFVYILSSINQDFARELEDFGILFSDYNFSIA